MIYRKWKAVKNEDLKSNAGSLVRFSGRKQTKKKNAGSLTIKPRERCLELERRKLDRMVEELYQMWRRLSAPHTQPLGGNSLIKRQHKKNKKRCEDAEVFQWAQMIILFTPQKALSSEKYFQPTVNCLIVLGLALSFCPSPLLFFMSSIRGVFKYSIKLSLFTHTHTFPLLPVLNFFIHLLLLSEIDCSHRSRYVFLNPPPFHSSIRLSRIYL